MAAKAGMPTKATLELTEYPPEEVKRRKWSTVGTKRVTKREAAQRRMNPFGQVATLMPLWSILQIKV